jgi:hypothetical protein
MEEYMNPQYTQEEYDAAKSQDTLPLKCSQCSCVYPKRKTCIQQYLSGKTKKPLKYCSAQCAGLSKHVTKKCIGCEALMTCRLSYSKLHDYCSFKCWLSNKKPIGINVQCHECGASFYRTPCHTHEFMFCNRSCAMKYQQKHKNYGCRVSKLEKWLQSQLSIMYPNLEILYNDKTTIRSELDIYIPSLKLAFEINGPFHYEPIYGDKQLSAIQNNDNRKFQACLEHGIELCIIDSSKQKYFKESTSKQYLDIIVTVISLKL